MLRIDDTDPTRTVPGGEAAILSELGWLGIAWEEGPLRQSDRGDLYRAAAERALTDGAAARDEDGSVRIGSITVVRPDGTATYQLASVADDLDLGVTHVIRGSDHRPNLEPQRAIARAVGGELPEVVHHGLLLGPDGKKLSKRHGHASVADLREQGLPASAVRAYLEELDLPTHDVSLDLARLQRLAIDAIAAMPDEELAEAADAPLELVPALRGARTLVEARAIAAQILAPVALRPGCGGETDARTLRGAPCTSARAPRGDRGASHHPRAQGGRRRSQEPAAGADRRRAGGELWAIVAALDRDEALRRA